MAPSRFPSVSILTSMYHSLDDSIHTLLLSLLLLEARSLPHTREVGRLARSLALRVGVLGLSEQ